MTDHAKFTFNDVFVPGEPHPDDVAALMIDPAEVPAYSQNQLDAIMTEAREEAKAEALAGAADDSNAAAAKTLVAIEQEIQRLGQFHDSIVQATHREAVELALLIGNKLARNLLKREPRAEVETLIQKLLAELGEVASIPRIAIRVHPVIFEDIRSRIAEMQANSDFSGEIIVQQNSELGPTDCQIDWSEGGARRDLKSLELEVSDTIGKYLSAISDGEEIGNTPELVDAAVENAAETPPSEPAPDEHNEAGG